MDITARLRGKRVAAATTNGNVLRITTEDGAELEIVWLGDDGRPVKGRPAVLNHGFRLAARGLQDLIHYPGLRTKGQA